MHPACRHPPSTLACTWPVVAFQQAAIHALAAIFFGWSRQRCRCASRCHAAQASRDLICFACICLIVCRSAGGLCTTLLHAEHECRNCCVSVACWLLSSPCSGVARRACQCRAFHVVSGVQRMPPPVCLAMSWPVSIRFMCRALWATAYVATEHCWKRAHTRTSTIY